MISVVCYDASHNSITIRIRKAYAISVLYNGALNNSIIIRIIFGGYAIPCIVLDGASHNSITIGKKVQVYSILVVFNGFSCNSVL